jgi:hypothetical protein
MGLWLCSNAPETVLAVKKRFEKRKKYFGGKPQ